MIAVDSSVLIDLLGDAPGADAAEAAANHPFRGDPVVVYEGEGLRPGFGQAVADRREGRHGNGLAARARGPLPIGADGPREDEVPILRPAGGVGRRARVEEGLDPAADVELVQQQFGRFAAARCATTLAKYSAS